MSPNDHDPEDSERAGHAGGPETGLVPVGMEMGDFAGSMAAVLTRAAQHPAEVAAASLRFGASLAQLGPANSMTACRVCAAPGPGTAGLPRFLHP